MFVWARALFGFPLELELVKQGQGWLIKEVEEQEERVVERGAVDEKEAA